MESQFRQLQRSVRRLRWGGFLGFGLMTGITLFSFHYLGKKHHEVFSELYLANRKDEDGCPYMMPPGEKKEDSETPPVDN